MVAEVSSPINVAILGNPNTGKSTLFNALAGARARVGNFPGVTVERKVAQLKTDRATIQLIDLPGTYSLAPRSLDEMVAVDVLLGRQPETGPIDLVICVVDASNLERNLYLVTQLLELGRPLLVVLNMWDVARTRGIDIDVRLLSERLGVPVVCTSAARREGIAELTTQIELAARRQAPLVPAIFPPAMQEAVSRLSATPGGAGVPEFLWRRLLLDVGGYVERLMLEQFGGVSADRLNDYRQELAAAGCAVPLVEARARYAWIRQQLTGVVQQPTDGPTRHFSDRIDRWITHRYIGLLIFAAVMFLIFQAIYRLGSGLAGWIETAKGGLIDLVQSQLGPGLFRSLIVDGAMEGVGGVLVFLPQIALLFLFIAVLEDCGYMARAAFLMDRWMSRLGLSGKSFVPLMSSFACAVPGIMATRVIESWRERLVTILVAPLMSCSARLPVYLLLIAAFIPPVKYLGGWVTLPGLVLLAMYSLGALVAIPVALALSRFVFPGQHSPFVLEMPSYRWPSLRVVWARVWDSCVSFVARAGTLIFATSVVVWALGTFPGDRTRLYQLQAEQQTLAAATPETASAEMTPNDARLKELDTLVRDEQARLVQSSFLGQMGHAIAPLVRPLGWDWKLGVGVLASFPAREVVIATLGTIYSLGGDVDESSEGLHGAMRAAAWPDGRPVYTIPVALSVMVFFALCAQCAATLMVIRRETNGWKWPIVTFVYMTTLAYVGAWIVYQLGTWWGAAS